MEDYLNYWLKKTVKETPNDMELGEKIREMIGVEENDTSNGYLGTDGRSENDPVTKWNKHKKDNKWIFERKPDTQEIRKRKI